MLQDIRPNSVLSDPENPHSHSHSRRSTETNQFSADTYAERLMDDLFQDVEQLLDLEPPQSTGAIEPASPVQDEFSPPALVPEVQLPPQRAMPLAPRLEESVVLQAAELMEEQSLAAVNSVAIAPDVAMPTTPPQTQNRWLPFLFAGGCVSVVMAVMLWWLYVDGKYRQQGAVASPESSSSGAANTQQFAEYLQKSLRNIDQQPSPTAGVALTPERNPTAPGLPTVVIPRSTLPSPGVNPAAPGAERVYVPVYQLPTNLYPPGTPVAPLPNVLKQTKPKAGATAPKTATANPAGVARKLVGVLEQGNNSVALFEMNGVTQRYELGESIGSSGWTLVEVSKNQAIVRRNGEVRSLFVGHSF
jgi:hypothetical protein